MIVSVSKGESRSSFHERCLCFPQRCAPPSIFPLIANLFSPPWYKDGALIIARLVMRHGSLTDAIA
jgi:hypothetical protein